MKERFKQVKRVIDGAIVFCYIKEQKKHWWSNWKAIMEGGAPLLFYKLPEGMRAINEIPNYKLDDNFNLGVRKPIGSDISVPLPIFPKGNADARRSMVDMVRNADEIYVGIKQDGKFYVAFDADSDESLCDLQNLMLKEE